MIFTERQITVHKGKSSINEPVILYRGDYEVSIKFTIMESKFRFKSGVNFVDSEKASHGQLAILAPYGGNVFSEKVKCEDGTVTFTLTKEMIDQLEEVGLYSFQIRLFDYYRESRVSIPPVEFGIEVREPVASEDHDNTVNEAIIGYSIAKIVDGLNEDVPDTFDAGGNYNKTDWKTGDRISQGKLNKIEDALDKINQNEKKDVAALDKRVTSNYNVLDSTKADKADISSNMRFMGVVDNVGALSSVTGETGDYYYSSGEQLYYMYSNKNGWECIGGGNYLDRTLETYELIVEKRYLNKVGLYTTTTSSGFRTLELSVTPKERYLICVRYRDSQRAYAFLDEKNNVIEVYPNDQSNDIPTTTINMTVEVPENAVKMRVGSYGIGTIIKAPIVDIDTELYQRVDNMESLHNEFFKELQLSTTSGKYLNVAGTFSTGSTSFEIVEIPVEPGDVYIITACYRDAARMFSIETEYDERKQIYPNKSESLPQTIETVSVTIQDKGILRIGNYRNGAVLKVIKLLSNVNTMSRSKVIDSLCTHVTDNADILEGKYINEYGNLITFSGFTTYEINVKAGEKYFVSGYYADSSRLYALTDSNNKVISVYPDMSGSISDTIEHDVLVDILVDGKLRVGSRTDKMAVLVKKYDLASPQNLDPDIMDELIDVTEQATIKAGYYVGKTGGITTLSSFSVYELNVKAGEQYFVSGSYTDASRLYSTLGDNGDVLSVYPDSLDNLPSTNEQDVMVNIMFDGILRVSQRNNAQHVAIKQNPAGHNLPLPTHILDDLNFCLLMNKVLCIGDSLTMGAYYSPQYNGSSIKEDYPYYFSKLNQLEVTNAGQSGIYPSKWYTDKRPNYDIAAHDNFIIWLGTNNGLTDTLESDTAFDDYNNYTETETGYYCRIIENILELRPDANIFLCTVFASSGDKNVTNMVLNQIASKYNLPLFDMDDGTIFRDAHHSILHPFGNNVHFGKVGNLAVAQKLTLYINEYARSNPSILEKVYIK